MEDICQKILEKVSFNLGLSKDEKFVLEEFLKDEPASIFLRSEFNHPYTVTGLVGALRKDGFAIREDSVEGLNGFLRLPALYQRYEYNPEVATSKDIDELKKRRKESKLIIDLQRLNRAILKKRYPKQCPERRPGDIIPLRDQGRWSFLAALKNIAGVLKNSFSAHEVKHFTNELEGMGKVLTTDVSCVDDELFRMIYRNPSDRYFVSLDKILTLPGMTLSNIVTMAMKFYCNSFSSFLRQEGAFTFNKKTKDESDDRHFILLRELEFFLWKCRKVSPKFRKGEFDTKYAREKDMSIELLCEAIRRDALTFRFKSQDNTIERLNELIELPSLYNELKKRHPSLNLSDELMTRYKTIEKIVKENIKPNNDKTKEAIREFNRLLLEYIYPEATPIWPFLEDNEYNFIFGLATLISMSYTRYAALHSDHAQKEADIITSKIDPEKNTKNEVEIFKNMMLKHHARCPYRREGKVCGKIFLKDGKTRDICPAHSNAEYQEYLRSLKRLSVRMGSQQVEGVISEIKPEWLAVKITTPYRGTEAVKLFPPNYLSGKVSEKVRQIAEGMLRDIYHAHRIFEDKREDIRKDYDNIKGKYAGKTILEEFNKILTNKYGIDSISILPQLIERYLT